MSIDAERTFWQNARYNADLAKRNAKPRNKNILIFARRWEGMTADEVLESLAKSGVVRNIRTLQRYAKMGLVPKPETKNLGRGKGKIADYPDHTPNELFASFFLLNASGASIDEVKRARELSYQMNNEKMIPMDELSPDIDKAIEEFFKYVAKYFIDHAEDKNIAELAFTWWLHSLHNNSAKPMKYQDMLEIMRQNT